MNNISNDVNNDLNKTIEALNHFVNIDDCDIEELKDEAELAREEYEDKDELTDRQKEKYDWLDEFASTLEDIRLQVARAIGRVVNDRVEGMTEEEKEFYSEQLEDITATIDAILNNRFRIKE